MQIVAIDFETYFDQEYSLDKMTTESYVRDPRFEAHGAAVRMPGANRSEWYDLPELLEFLPQMPWHEFGVICHHAQFDGLILAHRFGVIPKFWFDTLSMGRMMLGNHLSKSLDSLAKHFNLAPKSVPYNLFKGKHWHELAPSVQQQVAAGACHDNDLAFEIFRDHLGPQFPQSEYELVDMTIRMFTEPTLTADVNILNEVWLAEHTKKQTMLSALGLEPKELQSNEMFAQLLRDEGIEPATKPGKNGPIYQFAKSDEFMKGLLEDEDDYVRTLAECRLGLKSTINQTRAETLGYMASRGNLAVYLQHCGAHTTRWSGGDGSNFQNNKRGGRIRAAICAPDGYLLAPIDSSQIECRLLNECAGQQDVIEAFRQKQDVYAIGASRLYGETITKDTHPTQRFIGKKMELGCGYMVGWAKFQSTLKAGVDGPAIYLEDADAQNAVNSYREGHPHVCAFWRQADRMIAALASGDELQWGPFEISDHCIWLPNGAPIIYDTLEWYIPSGEDDPPETRAGWRFKTRKGWSHLYGGKLTENIIQGLARVVVSDAALRIKRAGFRIVGMEHDALWILIKNDGNAQQAYEFCLQEMKRTPTFLPNVPLDAEGHLGPRLLKG